MLLMNILSYTPSKVTRRAAINVFPKRLLRRYLRRHHLHHALCRLLRFPEAQRVMLHLPETVNGSGKLLHILPPTALNKAVRSPVHPVVVEASVRV